MLAVYQLLLQCAASRDSTECRLSLLWKASTPQKTTNNNKIKTVWTVWTNCGSKLQVWTETCYTPSTDDSPGEVHVNSNFRRAPNVSMDRLDNNPLICASHLTWWTKINLGYLLLEPWLPEISHFATPLCFKKRMSGGFQCLFLKSAVNCWNGWLKFDQAKLT